MLSIQVSRQLNTENSRKHVLTIAFMKISMKFYRQRARVFGLLMVTSLISYFLIRFLISLF